jgi:membrane-associated phospholipid phosphatase
VHPEPAQRVESAAVALAPWLPRRPPARAVLWLTTAARGGGLWIGIAALAATRNGAPRQAAAEGLGAVALSTVATHTIKRLVHRSRPRAALVPARRALPERVRSSSFPSSHAASAAAFTTAVTLRCPGMGVAVAPLATVVSYGRARTRVHWPSDVLAGAAFGAVIGWTVHRLARPAGSDRAGRISPPQVR